MTWTNERPSAPGTYWMRRNAADMEPTLERVAPGWERGGWVEGLRSVESGYGDGRYHTALWWSEPVVPPIIPDTDVDQDG